MERDKGITLIALVVTVIVLLILAGVSLSFVAGENGILRRATKTVDINEKMTAQEEVNLLVADLATQYYEEKYVHQREVEELDEYLKTALENPKETNGGYVVILNTEGKISVSPKGKMPISIGTIENGRVNWSKEEGGEIIIVPEVLENPTFSYDSTTEVETLTIKIVYPNYATKREYKIGTNGEWKTYKSDIVLTRNTTIYARYTARDERNSEEVSEQIDNVSINILKFTNASEYMIGTDNDEKIIRVQRLFERGNCNGYNDARFNIVYFSNECNQEVYFQDNKIEPIIASKVTIKSLYNTRGYEPIKEFYITASDTFDFSNEIELYRGEHILNGSAEVRTSEHQFEPKGSYQFYRLYITSWWPYNNGDGQNVAGCYIE